MQNCKMCGLQSLGEKSKGGSQEIVTVMLLKLNNLIIYRARGAL